MAEKKNENKIEMDRYTMAALFLGLLFILAAFQTMQLSELRQEVREQGNIVGNFSGSMMAYTGSPALQTGGGNAIPESLQNVPDMVGGC